MPRCYKLICRILAAWQEIIGLANTSQSGVQNYGGMARFVEGSPRHMDQIYSTILAAWQEIIGFAGMLQADLQNLGGMARSYWACQDLRIWYAESWQNGKVC